MAWGYSVHVLAHDLPPIRCQAIIENNYDVSLIEPHKNIFKFTNWHLKHLQCNSFQVSATEPCWFPASTALVDAKFRYVCMLKILMVCDLWHHMKSSFHHGQLSPKLLPIDASLLGCFLWARRLTWVQPLSLQWCMQYRGILNLAIRWYDLNWW